MATQPDVVPGLDLSSLSSITAAQFLQALQYLAPVSNIAFILTGAATPDVANNPRFSRYLWLDSSTNPPTIKQYSGGSWVAYSAATGAITTASFTTPVSNVNGVNLALLKNKADGSINAGDANNIICLDSNGQYVTTITRTALFASIAAGSIDVTKLVAGAAGQVIKMVSGVVAWSGMSFTELTGTISAGQIPAGLISDSMINAAAGIALSKLSTTGAGLLNCIGYNGAAWVSQTLAYPRRVTWDLNSGSGLPVGGSGAPIGGIIVTPSSPGFIPMSIEVQFVCRVADIGYAVGDIIAPEGQYNNARFIYNAYYDNDAGSANYQKVVISYYLLDASGVSDKKLFLTHKTTGVNTAAAANSNFYFRVHALG